MERGLAPTKDSADTVVVGAGVVGGAIAHLLAKAGQRVIVVAGVPLGTPGATNMLRIAFVGSETTGEM